ncbi:hypothetical protein Tco_1228196, partial [Tanacetum coccineum]
KFEEEMESRIIAYTELLTVDTFISKKFVLASLTHRLWEAMMSMKGFDAIEIIRVLERQLITVAAMADGSYHGFRTMAVVTVKGLDKAVIVRILAGQLITVAAMADASSLSIVGLSWPHVP